MLGTFKWEGGAMIQLEHMMGKEPLRRAGRDVAHDWYRLWGYFLWPTPVLDVR